MTRFIDRILRNTSVQDEQALDDEALADLRVSFKKVRDRTDRLIEEYRHADQHRIDMMKKAKR